MKVCTRCKITKSYEFYQKNSQQKDGLSCYCKECTSVINKEKRLRRGDKINARNRQWRLNNLESVRKKDSERNKNPARKASRNSRQRYYLVKYRSLGKMFQKEIESVYKRCIELNESSEKKFEVDHIIPIQGKEVCGLHVPWNLEIVSQFQNRSKGNKY